ncbi:hypothetical protein ACPPVW_18360 [Leifsonia sp. McL0607]|uniref:hypothetical protein n=1 Tax=Leifsonia sp. McL0607 TaxID=3415672 RepID=UPI003CEC7557
MTANYPGQAALDKLAEDWNADDEITIEQDPTRRRSVKIIVSTRSGSGSELAITPGEATQLFSQLGEQLGLSEGLRSVQDAIETVNAGWVRLESARTLLEQADALVDLSNSIHHLISHHPGFDVESGTIITKENS